MKKFLLIAVVLGVVAFQGYKILDRKAEERNARQRIATMFERLKGGTLADEQEAIGYWRVGHPEVPSEESVNLFARFRAKRGLGKIESYTVVSSRVAEGGDTSQRFIDFVCTVNGREVKIRARHGQPLEWID